MHNFKLGDKVYNKADSAPFVVVGIRKTTVEIQGDWSGGTHNVDQKSWVSHTEIQPYNQTKLNTEEEKIICPKCGNEENLHFNYDYGKKELPVINVLCNECGEFFEF